jgi:membrane peptidoglycan carboxypeptidase
VDNNWGQPHRVKVLSEAVTAEETSILKQNVESGTAVRSAISCPSAAKTGTTSELVDAWLDGYTPNYSTAVWMGYPTKRVSMTSVHGQPQQGGYLPAEIWHAYMSSVVEGKTCVPFSSSSESLSYQPFYGKFATTGQSRSSSSESENEEPATKPKSTHTNSPGGAGAGSPSAPPEPRPSAPPVPNKGPSTRETGGASPP